MAILQHAAPRELPWFLSLALLSLTTTTGTLLRQSRLAYDARVLVLAAGLLISLIAILSLVPRPADVALATVGNYSGWMSHVSPPNRWIQANMEHDGCRSASCLKFAYQRGGRWAGVYWVPWKCPDGIVAGGDCGIDLLATEALHIRRLSFYARGERGGEVVEFKVGGEDFPPRPVRRVNASLSKEWQRYTITLEGVDLTNAVGLFGWFAADVLNPEDITFYLDEIAFEGVSCPLTGN